ncbi:ataxin-1-like [Spea bombifrons]|uniref:ataxin-1-like n=1 Tax=Spea bombifrons TaxID=233779 RepID=UPI002349D044|nr:ataxin-1-like [Spea bombifrons]
MKPGHERSQECLPPKKRELVQSSVSVEEAPKVDGRRANDNSANETSGWSRGVLVAAGQGHGVRYEVAGEGAETVTVDQYGNLYKLAVPSATFSPPGLHPVVNMSPLQSSFNVASPLMQHPGITYPPIHYAPISHTSVQFLGSPYAVPYAVPPGFLPRAVISPPVTLAASHVPHYVPYNSILTEGVTPPPQPSSPHSFGKVTTAQSSSVLMGVVPVDVGKGRVPVFYQHSPQVPASYPVHEMIVACPSNPDPSPTSHNDKVCEGMITSTNGAQRLSDCVSDSSRHVIDQYIHNPEEQVVRGPANNLLDCDVYSGQSTKRTEVALMTHRSTPDADLEVQQVVRGLASQEFSSPSVQRKDLPSPLNLSHNASERREVAGGTSSHGNLASPAPERGQHRNTYSGQHVVKYTDRAAVVLNGELSRGAVRLEQSPLPGAPQPASKTPGAKSPDVHIRDTQSDRSSPHVDAAPMPPPHSAALPSHFMKGAIIQLATGELKRVEDLQTQDFVRSAEVSGGLKIDSSTVVDIQESQWPGFVTLHFVVGEQQSKVCLDVPPEHPFFVYGQGWSSCSPRQTTHLFALPCHRLQVGDVCISISLQSISKNGASTTNCTSTTQSVPHPTERATLLTRDRTSLSGRENEEESPLQKDGSAVAYYARASCPAPTTQSTWSSTGVQRFSPDPQPSPSRHTFIPQEVKLSIEGRSNAGK